MRLCITIVLCILGFSFCGYAEENAFALAQTESYMQRGTMQIGDVELPITVIIKRSSNAKYQFIVDSPAGVLIRAEYSPQGLCENIDVAKLLRGAKSEKLVNAIFQLSLGFGDCAELGTIRTTIENNVVRFVETDKIKISFDDYKLYDAMLVPRKTRIDAGNLKISLTLLNFKKR